MIILRPLLILVCLVLPLAGQTPLVDFFVLGDDDGPPSESFLLAPAPAGGLLAWDFTDPITHDAGGWITLLGDSQQPDTYAVARLRLPGRDPLHGDLVLTEDPTQSGWLLTNDPGGSLGPGRSLTAFLPVQIATSGGGAPVLPAVGVLALSGTVTAGYYHHTVLLQGALDVLPGSVVSLHVKQDFFPPSIVWVYAADPSLSTLSAPGGPPAPVRGEVRLARDPLQHAAFGFDRVALAAGSHVITAASGAGGLISLDPVTRAVSGSLSWTTGSTPLVRTLDGVQEAITGRVTAPVELRIVEAGLPGLGDLVLVLRKVAVVPAGAVPIGGQAYQPLLRAPPGVPYLLALSLDPLPGVNTGVGDVPLQWDWLLELSIDPLVPLFSGLLGVMPAAGEVRPSIWIPSDPAFAGFTFFLGGLVFDPLSGQPLAVTNPHRVTL